MRVCKIKYLGILLCCWVVKPAKMTMASQVCLFNEKETLVRDFIFFLTNFLLFRTKNQGHFYGPPNDINFNRNYRKPDTL